MNSPSKITAHFQAIQGACGIFAPSFAYYSQHLPLNLVDRNIQINEKCEQVAWLYGVSATTLSDCRSMGYKSKKAFEEDVVQALIAKSKDWHNWKCTTINSLYKKVSPFHRARKGKTALQTALSTLISGKVNNANAVKLGIEQQTFLIELHSRSTARDFKKTFKLFQSHAENMINNGVWPEKESLVSLATIKNFLKRPGVRRVWASVREFQSKKSDPVINDSFQQIHSLLSAPLDKESLLTLTDELLRLERYVETLKMDQELYCAGNNPAARRLVHEKYKVKLQYN